MSEYSIPTEFDNYTDLSSSVSATIIDGHSFRNLLEYLKLTNFKGSFRFRPSDIYYEEGNAEKTLVNQFQIFPGELIEYTYDSHLPEVVFGVTISSFRDVIKTTSKKDTVQLYKVADMHDLFIRILGGTDVSGRNGVSSVTRTKLDVIDYSLPAFDDNYPLCRVRASDLSKVFGDLSSIKGSTISISRVGNGIVVKSMLVNRVVKRVESLGDTGDITNTYHDGEVISELSDGTTITYSDSNGIQPIRCRNATIKSLSKINGLSHCGLVKIYFDDENRVIKFTCNVGSYGLLNIYIRTDPDL